MLTALKTKWTGKTVHGRRLYELSCSLVWSGYGFTITVPQGFPTDLASIPFGFRWLFPPDGPWAPAAVAHDFMCVNSEKYSRFFADAIFREIMAKELRVPWCKRLPIFYAVRFYGFFFHWRS